MKTSSISWQQAARANVDYIFTESTSQQLQSVISVFEGMRDTFNLILDTKASLELPTREVLILASGDSIWEYLAINGVSCLKMLNEEVSVDKIVNILVSKQKDYGPNNISRFGSTGILIRIHDKIARLENLLSKSDNSFNTAVGVNSVAGETVIDTVIDIIGYSIIGMMWNSVDRQTGLPDFLLPLV